MTRLPRRRSREQTLDAFFVSAPAGLVILNSDLRILRANDTIADIVGVSPTEIIGQTPSSLVPQLAPTVESLLRRVYSTGIPALNFPLTGETPKEPGVTRHWIVSVFPVRDINIAATCLGGIVVEVTDSVRLERVRRSEALLAEAERLAHVGSWEIDLLTGDGRRSANLCRLIGLDESATRFSESEFWDLIHPDDREHVRTIIEGAMKDVEPYEYQARFVLPNGFERVLLSRGKPVLDAASRVIKRVGVTQDITERIRAEQALQESEARYRDLVENSRDLICLHDLEGRLLWMNELPARILGYSRDDLIGRFIPDMLEAEFRREFDDYIARIRRDGHAEGMLRVVARSGEPRVWEYHNTLRTQGPGFPVVRGMAHDITELKRAEKRLRKQEDTVRGLFQTAQSLTQTLELDGILDTLNLRAMTLIGAEAGYAGLRTAEGVSCGSFFEGIVSKTVNIMWPPGVGIPGWVLQNKRTYLTNDAERDALACSDPRQDLNLRNVLCVPIFDVPKTEVIAFFAVQNKVTGFNEIDVTTAEGIAEIASIAIQNALSYQKLQHAEKQLQRLSAQLMTSLDQERRRIARALHEGTAQDLTGVKLHLGRLGGESGLKPSALEIVTESKELIERALGNIRTLSYNLHPPLLELGGLWVTIRSHAEKFTRTSGIPVSLDIPESLPRLSQAQEIAVFRILQECLTNIHLHSGSKNASIRVRHENGQVILEVSDAGRGFGAAPRGPQLSGLGITGMKERARELGGELEVTSNPLHGSTVRLSLPLGRQVVTEMRTSPKAEAGSD